MKLLKSWLQDHIVETLPSDETIVEALTLKSSEVEGVEKVGSDTVFDLKVLPDRAHYMLSHRGVAYDLATILGLTLKEEKVVVPEKGSDVSVNVESQLCTRYSATSIKNIKNGQSPEWLKTRLEAIGARSINALVDATNYAMFDTGQPLHAFDADKLVGGITVRLAKSGEVIETLDGKNITLKPHHLVIADDKGPLALAGVKGGKRAEVTLDTKNIILESACFNPVSVRKTSMEVGIRNDSSKRFENEITSHLVPVGLSIFLETLKKVSPECVIEKTTDIYTKLPEKWTVSVSHTLIESILNFSISEKRVIEILEKLGCVVEVKSSVYEVTPPFERLDIVIPEDIVDEIGRIEGLDKVKAILPHVKTTNTFDQEFLLIEKIKDFFISRGFTEIQTRSLLSKGDIEVAYPMASDKAFLRTDLSFAVVEALELAGKNTLLLGLEKIALFEIGKTFPKSGEQLDLCFGVYYAKKIKNKDAVIKEELEKLLSELEKEIGNTLSSSVSSNTVQVIHLEQIKSEIKPEIISMTSGSRTQFVPFSQYPFIVRDVAVFVPSTVSIEEVHTLLVETLKTNAGNLLVKGPDLFDQFEKEGKKSLAFRMIFQSFEKTLSDSEVNVVMEAVYSALKAKTFEIR